ncbi:glycerate kinase [Oleiharenicola lentus]|uniref:glycerate kinase n=1 Tax=Oleiharenicola lentus TaxID=2508720 RepID=UPI003F67CD0A
MTRVLLAFDKFKDAMIASQACEAAASALREVQPTWTLESAPLADGGEGFATILTQAARGTDVTKAVAGPRGAVVDATFGLVRVEDIPVSARTMLRLDPALAPDAHVAVIEMATASGLALLAQDQRDPWQTTTVGTGELMRQAAESGAVAILLGVGGSATNDLGLGALTALGFSFFDENGRAVALPVPANWSRITAVRGKVPEHFPPVYIACDVTNPLLGARGAAAVYGPQKGLRAEDHARIENESERLANLLCAHVGRSADLKNEPGSGAAGGIAFGLMAAVGAKLLPGFELVSAWLDLERKIAAADLVITGEGRFDESSLEGKGPGAVAARALARGKIVHVFAGQVASVARPGLSLHAITPGGMPLSEALRQAAPNLHAATRATFSLPL